MKKFYGSETLYFEGELLSKKLLRLAEIVKEPRDQEISAQEVQDLNQAITRLGQDLETWKKYVIDHCQRQVK